MNIDDHPLIAALRRLRFDPEDFVIFGSAPLLAHGLRHRISDLDVVARGAVWTKACAMTRHGIKSGPYSQAPMVTFAEGSIEISRQWIDDSWDVDELIDDADVIGGLRFARLSEVLAYKRLLGRDKDLADIPMLERYIRDGDRTSRRRRCRSIIVRPGRWSHHARRHRITRP